MIVEIDHLLIAVADPDAAAARLIDALGLPPAGGGHHPTIGTRNALLSLGGPYLELIGLADLSTETRERADAHPIGAAVRAALGDETTGPTPRWASEDGRIAGGYASVALRSDDLAGDVERLGAAGSPLVEDVVRRARPDGSVIEWPVAFPPRLGLDGPGFLIEHAPDEPERAARLRAPGPRLARLSLRVADPAAVASAWEASLGLRFTPSGPATAGSPGSLHAMVGPHTIALEGAIDTDPDDPDATIVLLGRALTERPSSPDGVRIGCVRIAWG